VGEGKGEEVICGDGCRPAAACWAAAMNRYGDSQDAANEARAGPPRNQKRLAAFAVIEHCARAVGV
jgi:hypothetical protein